MTSGATTDRPTTNKCVVCHRHRGLSARLTGNQLCRTCWKAVGPTVRRFQEIAPTVLRKDGIRSEAWSSLLQELLTENIPLDYALSLIRGDCEAYLERFLTFCFSDQKITEEEVSAFYYVANSLEVHGRVRKDMELRLSRGLLLTSFADGKLPPTVTPTGVQVHVDERFYLDIPAQYQRVRRSSTQLVYGRVLVSNTKLRFVGQRSGTDNAWGPIDGWELSGTKF
jgi:hypothetical protein